MRRHGAGKVALMAARSAAMCVSFGIVAQYLALAVLGIPLDVLGISVACLSTVVTRLGLVVA